MSADQITLDKESFESIKHALNLAELYIISVKDLSYKTHIKSLTTLESTYETTEDLIINANKFLGKILKGK